MSPTERPPCPNCITAATYPQHRWFNPACLHCGARMIQHLGCLPIAASEITQRRRQVLLDWAAHGHSEKDLRALAKGPLAIAPLPAPVTPATAQASAPPVKAKRR